MAATAGELSNIALSYIGNRDPINDFVGDNTVEAITCRALFDSARDQVLEAYPWPFAAKRSVLALLSGVERTGWAYVYSLPADCIAPRRLLVPGARAPAEDQKYPFAIELNDAGDRRVLMTDVADAELLYTARVEQVPLWTPLFQNALTWRLAAQLCAALAVKFDVAAQIQRGYQAALSEAIASAARQSQADTPLDVDFIRVR